MGEDRLILKWIDKALAELGEVAAEHPGRELSLVKTKLEEARMWGHQAADATPGGLDRDR